MTDYSIVQNVETGAEDPNWIRRISDSAFIPKDPQNRDYREFLAWQDSGGEILSEDPLYVPYVKPTANKEQLLAQLADIKAQIEALPEDPQ
ncbi:MAG: hypothetical protein SFX19_10195 [Alphaproteobacteria bacterium]|nr:hypothetical protein [Alphaproteobacteria bacterium]